MLRATAGDTDVSRRFLCLHSSTFSFSLDYLYYFYYFGVHLFHSSECTRSKNSRLVHGRDSLVHFISRAAIHVRGRSYPRMYTCCPHQSARKHKFTSCCCNIASILQWMCLPKGTSSESTCKTHGSFFPFPNTFLYTSHFLNIRICILVCCLHTDTPHCLAAPLRAVICWQCWHWAVQRVKWPKLPLRKPAFKRSRFCFNFFSNPSAQAMPALIPLYPSPCIAAQVLLAAGASRSQMTTSHRHTAVSQIAAH